MIWCPKPGVLAKILTSSIIKEFRLDQSAMQGHFGLRLFLKQHIVWCAVQYAASWSLCSTLVRFRLISTSPFCCSNILKLKNVSESFTEISSMREIAYATIHVQSGSLKIEGVDMILSLR